MMGALVTSAIAHKARKAPFYFSRFNFTRMKERGNTHYCFHCGGQHGFTPGANGEALNAAADGYEPMSDHDPIAHADGVVGEADRFGNVWEWLEGATFPRKFPFVVNVPEL